MYEEVKCGTRRLIQRTFVVEPQFQALYKGKAGVDEGRCGELTTHQVSLHEAAVAGRWVRGVFNTHIPGHELFEHYEDHAAVMQVEHESGKNMLSKGQAEAKFAALRSEREDTLRQQEQKCSQLSVDAMMKMLGGMSGVGAYSVDVAEEGTEPDHHAATGEIMDEDEESDEPAPSSSLFGRMRGQRSGSASAAKPIVKAGGDAKSSPNVSSSTGGGGARAAINVGDSGNRAATVAPGAVSVINLSEDGRVLRLLTAVEDEHVGILEEYKQFATLRDLIDPDDIFGRSVAYQKRLKIRQRDIVRVFNKCKATVRRIEISKFNGAAPLQECGEKIKTILTNLGMMRDVVTCLCKPDPTPFLSDLLDELPQDDTIQLNCHTLALQWRGLAKVHIGHGHHSAAVALFMSTATNVLDFNAAVASSETEHRAPATAVFILESIFLDLVESTKADHVTKRCGPVEVMMALGAEVVNTSEKLAGENRLVEFLAEPLTSSIREMQLLLSRCKKQLAEMFALVEKYQRDATDAEICNSAPPLKQRLLLHEAGILIVGQAAAFCSAHMSELRKAELANKARVCCDKIVEVFREFADADDRSNVDMSGVVENLASTAEAMEVHKMSETVVAIREELGKRLLSESTTIMASHLHDCSAGVIEWLCNGGAPPSEISGDLVLPSTRAAALKNEIDLRHIQANEEAFEHSEHLYLHIAGHIRKQPLGAHGDRVLAGVETLVKYWGSLLDGERSAVLAVYPEARLDFIQSLFSTSGKTKYSEWHNLHESTGDLQFFYSVLKQKLEHRQVTLREATKSAISSVLGAKTKDEAAVSTAQTHGPILALADHMHEPLFELVKLATSCFTVEATLGDTAMDNEIGKLVGSASIEQLTPGMAAALSKLQKQVEQQWGSSAYATIGLDKDLVLGCCAKGEQLLLQCATAVTSRSFGPLQDACTQLEASVMQWLNGSTAFQKTNLCTLLGSMHCYVLCLVRFYGQLASMHSEVIFIARFYALLGSILCYVLCIVRFGLRHVTHGLCYVCI